MNGKKFANLVKALIDELNSGSYSSERLREILKELKTCYKEMETDEE